jgi:hypothetical protein
MAKYWFRQKRYGYGATPTSWQGWLLIAVSIAVVIAGLFLDRANPDKAWLNTLLIFVVLAPFVVVGWLKTEGGWRWRWGDDD